RGTGARSGRCARHARVRPVEVPRGELRARAHAPAAPRWCLGTRLVRRRAHGRRARAAVAQEARRGAAALHRVGCRLSPRRRAPGPRGAGVFTFGALGNRATALPAGVTDSDLDLEALLAGRVVSGAHGNLVFAAARVPSTRPGARVVVLTRKPDTGLRSGGR